jgi:hypothetical protein
VKLLFGDRIRKWLLGFDLSGLPLQRQNCGERHKLAGGMIGGEWELKTFGLLGYLTVGVASCKIGGNLKSAGKLSSRPTRPYGFLANS